MNSFLEFLEFIFTKNELLLSCVSNILSKSFRRLFLQNTSSYICRNSKKVVQGLFKTIQNYANNNNYKLLIS